MTRIKVKITDREKQIIKVLVKLAAEGKSTFTMDFMYGEVYKDGTSIRFPRSALAATLRNFGYKLYQAGGYRLKRVSALGTGARGEYEFAGDFARLLKDLPQDIAA